MEINNMDLIKEIYKTVPWGDPIDDLRGYTIEYKIMNIDLLMCLGKPHAKATISLFGIYTNSFESNSIYIGKVIANIEYINNKIQCGINTYMIAPDFKMLNDKYSPFRHLTAPEEPNKDIIIDLVEKADIISRGQIIKYIKEGDKNDMNLERAFNLHFNLIKYRQLSDAAGNVLYIFNVHDTSGKLGSKLYRMIPKFHGDLFKTRQPDSWLKKYETVLGFSLVENESDFMIPVDVKEYMMSHHVYDNWHIIYCTEREWNLPETFDLTVLKFNNIPSINRIDCKADMKFKSSLDSVILRQPVKPTWFPYQEAENNAALKSEIITSEEQQLYWKKYVRKTGRYLVPGTFEIKDIKFSGIATIVFWNDNTKTVVKMDKTEKVFDVEKAIMAAYMKKALETMGGTAKERSLDEVLKKYTAKYEAEKKEAKKKSKKTKKKD